MVRNFAAWRTLLTQAGITPTMAVLGTGITILATALLFALFGAAGLILGY